MVVNVEVGDSGITSGKVMGNYDCAMMGSEPTVGKDASQVLVSDKDPSTTKDHAHGWMSHLRWICEVACCEG